MPDERILLAVIPFGIAILIRVLLGRSQITNWSVTLGTMWFTINVLLTPYADGMRSGLVELGQYFR